MLKLKHSSVRRRGVTSRKWYGRTEEISAVTMPGDELRFSFVLPSKGGGKTKIELTLGAADIRSLLRLQACLSPKTAELFASCTQAAVQRLVASGKLHSSAA